MYDSVLLIMFSLSTVVVVRWYCLTHGLLDTAKSIIRVHFINFVVESQQANRSLPHVFVTQNTVADLPYQLCNFESFFVFFLLFIKGGEVLHLHRPRTLNKVSRQ